MKHEFPWKVRDAEAFERSVAATFPNGEMLAKAVAEKFHADIRMHTAGWSASMFSHAGEQVWQYGQVSVRYRLLPATQQVEVLSVTKTGADPRKPVAWPALVLSVVPLLVYLCFLPTFQHRSPRGITTDIVGVSFGVVVALNSIYWFLRCPRTSLLIKILTLVPAIVSIWTALQTAFQNILFQHYGAS
jgi:hypothetical protein